MLRCYRLIEPVPITTSSRCEKTEGNQHGPFFGMLLTVHLPPHY